jgi:nucleoside-diphosphate-sugar epimerase
MRVGITGASGYLGSMLIKSLQEANFEVVSLNRRIGTKSSHIRYYDLRLEGDAIDLDGLDCVIHCALQRSKSSEEDLFWNDFATLNLISKCYNQGKNFILISSVLACDSKLSSYSRIKSSQEVISKEYSGTVIRIGVLRGENIRPAFHSLIERWASITSFLGRVPLPDGRIWLTDYVKFVKVIETSLKSKNCVSTFINCFETEPKSFSKFAVELLEQENMNKKRRIMVVKLRFVIKFLRVVIPKSIFFRLRFLELLSHLNLDPSRVASN